MVLQLTPKLNSFLATHTYTHTRTHTHKHQLARLMMAFLYNFVDTESFVQKPPIYSTQQQQQQAGAEAKHHWLALSACGALFLSLSLFGNELRRKWRTVDGWIKGADGWLFSLLLRFGHFSRFLTAYHTNFIRNPIVILSILRWMGGFFSSQNGSLSLSLSLSLSSCSYTLSLFPFPLVIG